MKRLLIATTAAVTLVGGAAYAEVTMSGDARMGLKARFQQRYGL